MFAPPHAPTHSHSHEHPYGPPDAYSFVPAPNPPAIPLNGLAYLQHAHLHQHQHQHQAPPSLEHRRSNSLPQTPAPGPALNHLQPPPQSQRYFMEDLSPSSSAAPPNIARQQQQQQQMYVEQHQQMMHIPALPRRARGERISTRDFVPPDVTGLSKREARLVKNRAAAFLSRQRKREEFEAMELRVADLEAQNAALLGQISGGVQAMAPSDAHAAHVAALTARIATLERELAQSLSETSRSPSPSSSLGSHSVDASSTHSSHHHHHPQQTVGMGLMALLSLCSMSPPATKFAFTATAGGGAGGPESEPTPVTATPFNYDSIARWQERLAASSPAPPATGAEETVDFDIAFSQTEDNRIRCHVSVPPTHSLLPHPQQQQQMYSSSPPEYGSRSLPGSAGAYTTTFADSQAQQQWQQQQQQQSQQLGPARRVRVALRATQLSTSGNGDWEVEVC